MVKTADCRSGECSLYGTISSTVMMLVDARHDAVVLLATPCGEAREN